VADTNVSIFIAIQHYIQLEAVFNTSGNGGVESTFTSKQGRNVVLKIEINLVWMSYFFIVALNGIAIF